MTPINPERQMVVDRSDCSEIKGAVAVDIDLNTVTVSHPTYTGTAQRTVHVPAGVRVVLRR